MENTFFDFGKNDILTWTEVSRPGNKTIYNEGAWDLGGGDPHAVLPRDSHEISLTIGGVHKLMILLRDLLNEQIHNIFGEERGGSGGPRPLYFFRSLKRPTGGERKSSP